MGEGHVDGIAISDDGKVAASVNDRVYLWKAGKTTPLPEFGHTNIGAFPSYRVTAINPDGVIGGGYGGGDAIFSTGLTEDQAFLWHQGRTIKIGEMLSGCTHDVNERGDAVGESERLGWIRIGGKVTSVPIPPNSRDGDRTAALAINRHRVVVGETTIRKGEAARPARRAFVLARGHLRLLPIPRGTTDSIAWDVNDEGLIVGSVFDSAKTPVTMQPVVWSRFRPHVLPTLGGASSSANRVNRKSWIVGWSSAGGVLWVRNQVYDLNRLAPSKDGWRIISANDINSLGWIVGVERKGELQRPILLKPTPK